jgi:hypothetical protein
MGNDSTNDAWLTQTADAPQDHADSRPWALVEDFLLRWRYGLGFTDKGFGEGKERRNPVAENGPLSSWP